MNPSLNRNGTWRTYTTAGGLAALQVEHIAADRGGDLWVATCTGGVSRFDGDEFRTFTSRDGLCGDQVYAMCLDRQGRLWFGTWTGCCWYDGRSFHCFTEDHNGISNGHITFIFEDREGFIWLGGRKLLGYYDGNSFQNLLPEYFRKYGQVPSSSCWGIAQDKEGHLWFGFENVACYDGSSFHTFGREDGLPPPVKGENYAIGQDLEGNLWIGGEGIGYYDGRTFQPISVEPNVKIRKIQQDREGRIWFCTSGDGVLCYDGMEFHHFTPREGVAFNYVNGMFQDSEGSFWFATWGGGVTHYDPYIQIFRKEEGLPQNDVYTLLEDLRGNIWMGFSSFYPIEKSVACYDGERIVVWGVEQGLDIEGCLAIYEDHNGHLWFGGHNGLIRYSGQTFQRVGPEEFDGIQVKAVIEDEKERLLFSHWNPTNSEVRITCYNGLRFQTVFKEKQEEYFGLITTMIIARDHSLWFALGTWLGQGVGKGIRRLNDKEESSFYTTEEGLVDSRVEDLLEDQQGVLWIATLGGISCFDGAHFHNFTAVNGLPNNHVRCIYEDRQGHLWFGTDGGVVHYDGRIFQTLHFDHIASTTKIIQDRKGRFWFATMNGAVCYTPSHVPPRVRMLQTIADQVYRGDEAVEISTSTQQIVFEYKGMSFRTHPRDMLYTYRLQGYEEDWQPATPQKRAYYQDLPLGEYIFQVKAIGWDLNESESAEAYLKVVQDERDQKIDELEQRVRERTRELEETHRKLEESQARLIAELEAELQTAHDLQMSLMPKEAPKVPGFDFAGRCFTANHVGGDFFKYYRLPQGHMLGVLADVTGHAMEAAVPLLMFSGILESQVELGGTIEELFGRLNRSLHRTLPAHTFVCLVMGELDPSTRTLRLSDAGCPYPYHYRAATGEVAELQVDAYPLGVRPDTTYREIEVQLEPGDRVVFCSDGIIEATNEAGEMFGFERTGEMIRRGCAEDLSAEALLERIVQEVKAFSGEVPQGDDQTVVVVKVEPC